MNPYDPQKAARVWQRVQTQQQESRPEGDLQALMMEKRHTAAIYAQLARQLPGKESPILQRLHREEQSHTACLRGICTLIAGDAPIVPTPPIPKDPPELTLRKCYAREMRSLKEYESRMSDPEYGPVFARLAEQEREHCRAVLELIGGLGKKA